MEKKREERKCARVVGRGTLEKEEGKVEGKTPTTLLQFFSLPKTRAQASTQNVHGKTKSLDEDNRARDTAQSLCVVILGDIPRGDFISRMCCVCVRGDKTKMLVGSEDERRRREGQDRGREKGTRRSRVVFKCFFWTRGKTAD